ncbi:hypothetical protein 1013_scaffold47_00075 [Bacteriophage sp.]|nr:hypothetical protein 1013_scaffold47_00075 [Bacteriophage sp.]
MCIFSCNPLTVFIIALPIFKYSSTKRRCLCYFVQVCPGTGKPSDLSKKNR